MTTEAGCETWDLINLNKSGDLDTDWGSLESNGLDLKSTIWGRPEGKVLKSRNSKIGLHSALSWPKIGIEPKFHEDVTSGG